MAQNRSGILFGAFRLDVAGGRLWKGDQPVALQPRPLAVLAYLAARPGQVVGRDELLATLWADTHVTKAVLKVAVRAVREAIDDDAEAPRFIETVGREGYRFIGGADVPVVPRAGAAAGGAAMVGRDADLARLHDALAHAVDGRRTMVFVSGEPGIGKTTLLDRFVADVTRAGGVRVARGQCLEQYGEGEAYLPVLEALGALARDDAGGQLAATLARHAPTWMAHLAALDPAPREPARSGSAVAATPARMLRELADALDVFTAERPLLLVLDDLQWSDRSSVDLLACLARRPHRARLLVVGSFRPADMRASNHPLLAVQHELQAKGLCEEIALSLLSRDDVGRYLAARFGGAPDAALRRLTARVHERTEGNALFMLNMVNDLVTAGLLAWRDGRWQVEGSVESATDRIPTGLRELLDRRLHRLAAPTRKVLEAASVAGDEFAVAAVAAAAQMDAERVEDVCEELAAQGALIADAGLAEWPDGSVSGRYRFQHALYRSALYEGIAEARRVALHRAIGRREEAGFADRADEHAAELAMHYGRGRSYPRALHFHALAAAAALDRHAPHEAVAHYSAALEALAQTPATAARARRELPLAVARATLLMAIEGYAAPATEQAFARARVLCDALPGPQRYPVLRGLLSYLQVRADFAQAQTLSAELLHLAERRPGDTLLVVQAHYGAGTTVFHCGALPEARTHLEAALRRYDPATHRRHVLTYGGYDPGVACGLWLAWTLILQGEIDEALAHMRDGVALAERHGDAFTLAWAHQAAGTVHQLLGDWPASAAASADAMRLAEEHDFPHVLGMATANRGWALMMRGETAAGIALLRDGVAMVEQTGARLVRPSFLGMLAAADLMQGDGPRAAARMEEAFAEMDRTGERLFEAALLVLKSRLLVTGGERRDEAEACLRQALEVTRAQGARLLELRAAVALARHARGGPARTEARQVLAAAHAWFEGRPAATREIVAARELLKN